jgi:hypothetical protein
MTSANRRARFGVKVLCIISTVFEIKEPLHEPGFE